MTVHEHAIAAEMPARLAIRPGTARPFACSSAVLPGVVMLLDGAAIVLAAVLMLQAPVAAGLPPTGNAPQVGFLMIGGIALASRAGLYGIGAVLRPERRIEGIILAMLVPALLLIGLGHLVDSMAPPAMPLLKLGALAALLAVVFRLAACRVAGALARHGVIGRNLAVLGSGEEACRLLRHLNAAGSGFTRFVGVYGVEPVTPSAGFEAAALLGGPEALLEAARLGRVDDVVVAVPWQQRRGLRRTIERLSELPVDIYLASDLVARPGSCPVPPAELARLPLLGLARRPISGWGLVAKRAEDLLLASLLLVLLSPMLALIALAIRLDSPGPVLFRQQRLGFNNRVFSIYKFRSMHHRPDPAGAPQARRGDPRVTRVGRFIRRTSLDELPQLLNVIEGSMSLVGPRPHALSHNAEYGRRIRGYFARHKVKPGITGWAQVRGLRGETARLGLMRERVRHDSHYVDNWSVLFDLRILALTALVVLFQRSAY